MDTILIPVFGGLGNQMFQVAHALKLNKKTGHDLSFIDLTNVSGRVPRKWELDCFNIKPLKLSKSQINLIKLRIFSSRKLQKIHTSLHLGVLEEGYTTLQNFNISSPKICTGYWQGENHFESVEYLVKQTFKFPQKTADSALLEKLSAPNSVAVHVRRGDYISDPVAYANHFVCTSDWYIKAINEMRKRVNGAKFIIFSDDPSWAFENLGSKDDVTIADTIPNSDSWNDMALMSMCKNFIISNSSYSWWASYLGKTIQSVVIAPAFWFPNVLTSTQYVHSKDWVLL